MRYAEVEWVDSNSCGGWHDPTERPDTVEVISIGYVVFENDNQIILAQSIGNGQYHNSIAIPKCSIKGYKK